MAAKTIATQMDTYNEVDQKVVFKASWPQVGEMRSIGGKFVNQREATFSLMPESCIYTTSNRWHWRFNINKQFTQFLWLAPSYPREERKKYLDIARIEPG